MASGDTGSIIELKVSSRGISYTLKSSYIEDHAFVSDTESEATYSYKKSSDSKTDFENTLCSLHNIGFSVSEISEITGKTPRVINYALSKLEASKQIKSHGRGRPVINPTRDKKPVTLQLYKDNYDFLMKEFGNVSNIVNDLIDEYRRKHEKE